MKKRFRIVLLCSVGIFLIGCLVILWKDLVVLSRSLILLVDRLVIFRRFFWDYCFGFMYYFDWDWVLF